MKKKDVSISLRTILIFVVVALGLGIYYRSVGLETRPMHTDEAILATKFGTLWTEGTFDYDPSDYHGPGLHQVSWLYAKLARWGSPDEWTEAQLRHIPMLCGILVLGMTLLFARPLTWHGSTVAMLLIAVSPMQVFYSRYYIMEMLLVLLLSIALWALWKFVQTGGKSWLALLGASLGFAHATKETFVINVFAGVCGYAIAKLIAGGSSFQQSSNSLRLSSSRSKQSSIKGWQWLIGAAVAVSVASYSGFTTDLNDVKESVTTYTNYLHRSEGAGHSQPWYYYLTMLFYRSADGGIIWSEALIGALGIVGIIAAPLSQDRDGKRVFFMVFLAVYTVVLYVVYSFISYKTPWSILSAQHALTLMAGYGAATLWTALPGKFSHILQRLVIIGGIYHMCAQCMLAIDQYRADARNPYVYSHTTTNLINLVDTVRELVTLDPLHSKVQVISRDQGWPLPWYFRNLKNVGYQANVPATLDAPIIIFDSDQKPDLDRLLFGKMYQETGPYGLRPLLFLNMLVEDSLWKRHMEKRTAESSK